MINWKHADSDDKKLLSAIYRLFLKRTDIVEFIFHPTRPQLSLSADQIRSEVNGYGTGHNLLIRIALDIWSGDGGINFNEIYQKLDEQHFYAVISTLGYLKNMPNIYMSGRIKKLGQHGYYDPDENIQF